MSWARYDDMLPMNKKWVALRSHGVEGAAALGLHLLANTWCRHNGTAGHVDNSVVEMLVGKTGSKLAALLVKVGMFDVQPGGWCVHDYAVYHDPNDSSPDRSASERTRDVSRIRADAGRKGGLAKAGNATVLLQANGWQSPSPVPVPVPVKQVSLPPIPVTVDSPVDNRRRKVISHYANTALHNASNVTNPKAYHLKAQHTAATNPDLDRWLDMFPDAPPDAIAAWLHGDRGSMAYYKRADEGNDAKGESVLLELVPNPTREETA